MLRNCTSDWGETRKINGDHYDLYDIATYTENQNPQDYRKRMRQSAKEEGYSSVRILKNFHGDYACYVKI